MPKQPIIFDFIACRAYRSDERSKDLAETMKNTAANARLGRVVRTAVEGLPPQAVSKHSKLQVLLDWAVSCDAYEIHEDESADIVRAGTDTLYVDALPARAEVTLLVRVRLDENEHSTLDVIVIGPSTTPLGVLTHEVKAQPGTNHRPGHVVHQIEPIEVGFLADTEGFYSVEIYTEQAQRDPADPARRQTLVYSVRLDQSR